MSARIIYDRSGKEVYLRRWYLLGERRMPDGSRCFDAHGAMKPGAPPERKLLGMSLYLHCIHKPDSEPELHNHPWRWALALILKGGYREERRTAGNSQGVVARVVRPLTLNRLTSSDFHRISSLRDGPSWSLFLVGPRFQNWGFWNRATRIFTPWREFIAKRRAVTPAKA